MFVNIAELSAYRGGQFWRWVANTARYAGVGAAVSAALSGLSGYRNAGQCSGLQAGGEGPRWEGRQGPSSALTWSGCCSATWPATHTPQ
ncbi:MULTISPECIES: hypothetical protein [unclassified Solwaraspora]|uniref:hypothetical protein n=1 Tax=unclassified Solwaraspora TaxID=2627926 RepID=UPI00248B78BF|nr:MULTISPECIES: hypothetical protein [unclassified Solwaraspora]WBB98548.1 hypothetical protein O7553_06425 [Solwaraspora sp. WMMA2059]WBC22900.1 hypothetical protein O7543_10940 [Solwaraspora sp. WMMA2080]WJK35059.1 hypothetical protein O7610_01230 [Solwaraspora sp. WMMA2065]